MATSEHLEILNRGVAEWNRWRAENSRLVPDLSDARLSIADLAGFDLRKCKLDGAVLKRADLGSSLLSGADLTGADLSHAYLGSGELYRRAMAGAAINTEPGTILLAEGVDLSKASLVEANLSGAYLRCADLSHADLRKSRLESAHLFAANLRSAQLQEANLDGADLSAANLTDANLTGANLAAVNLWGAMLKDADFTNARFMYTILAALDLSKVKGLNSTRHDGPSTLGIDTLAQSSGTISDAFLRACGLPDEFIEQNRSWIGSKEKSYSCFISYSHADSSFAGRLAAQLQARGIRCWLDKKDMKPGERILDSVNDAIRIHDKILLCCSETSLKSRWVKDEIRKAHEREHQLDRNIIIPLNLDGYLLAGWEDGLAADLRSRLAADFTNWEFDNAKFEEQFEHVVQALRSGDVPE